MMKWNIFCSILLSYTVPATGLRLINDAGPQADLIFMENQGMTAFNDGGAWVYEGKSTFQMIKTSTTSRATYGFYLHMFAQPYATVILLRELRRTYPEAPVFIMSDGGMDFSGICKEIGTCEFKWKPPANDRWNPVPFFDRFREAASWLNTKYVVMLEPDNTIVKKMPKDPKLQSDAGGMNDWSNPHFTKELQEYMTERARIVSGNPKYEMKWTAFGLCGGSIYKTNVILDALNPDLIDWATVRKLAGDMYIYSSDVAMPIALVLKGYTFYPWSQLTQTRYGLNPDAAWRHWGSDEGKPNYGLNPADQHLVTRYSGPVGQSVTCQGCVWVHDDVCWAQTPPACPVTQHDHYGVKQGLP